MRHSLRQLVFTLFLISFVLPDQILAQGGVYSEADIIKQAQKHFDNKNYEQALPLYSQIVSNQPAHANFNYCLGVCLLKVDGNKADAVRFLTIATQSSETPINSWLYLGMALHQAYRFDEAITTLQTFRKSSGKQGWKESGGDQLIQMCQNAINLNNDLSLLRHSILQETVANCSDVVTLYKNIGTIGRFLKMPKEYETKQSKNMMECSQVFLTAKNNVMVYSAPGKTGQSGLDIYKVTRDQKGLWNFPEPISTAINTSADEAYPVLVNDGTTLYFSSKGAKSTGGYDVFRSDYDRSTGAWSEPVSMGSPVNSPADDFYYIPFGGDKSGYFASDRESPSGKCKVYTASVIKENRNFVTINGTFVCPAGLDLSDAKVTILNADDRSLLAQFRTATQNGTYFLKLPSPSKLIFQVRLPGFNDMESEVTFEQPDEVTLIQEIIVKRETSGKESLKIVTKAPEAAAKMAVKNAETTSEAPKMMVQNRPVLTMKSGKNHDKSPGDFEIINTTASGSKTAPTVLAISKTEVVKVPETDVKTKKQSAAESSNSDAGATEAVVSEPLVSVIKSTTSEVKVGEKKEQPDAAVEEKSVTKSIEPVTKSSAQNDVVNDKDNKSKINTREPGNSEPLDKEVIAMHQSSAITDEEKSKVETKQKEVLTSGVSSVNSGSQETLSANKKSNSKIAEFQSAVVEPEMSVKNNKTAEPAIMKDEFHAMEATKTNAVTGEADAGKMQDTKIATEKNRPSITTTTKTASNSNDANTVSDENQQPTTGLLSGSSPTAVNSPADGKVSSHEPDDSSIASIHSSTNAQKSERKKRKSSSSLKKKSSRVQEPAVNEIPATPVEVAQQQPTLQDVIFRVQLGAFRDRSEEEVKKKFETTGIGELEYLKNNEGFLVVVTGHETDYLSAIQLKEAAIKKGITDAFIVVYSGDNRLPVSMVVFEDE